MTRERPESGARLPRGFVLALATSAALSIAIVPTRGNYRADAMAFLFVALGFVLWQLPDLLFARRSRASVSERRVVIGLVVVLAGFSIMRLVDQKLLANARESWWTLRVLIGVELALLATYLRPSSASSETWRSTRFWLLAAITFVAGIQAARLVPNPPIDVWQVQMDGARALLAGHNPFEVVQVHDTAPDATRTDIPYVYPPLQVLLTIPTVLLGDARYTMVAAIVVIGVAFRSIARSSGRRVHPLVEDAPALFVWFGPKLFHIVEQSWIDPVQVAFIAGSAALALRRRTLAAALVLGFALASKQSMFWVVPIMVTTFGFGVRELVVTLLVPAVIYAPFALWNFQALKFANLDIQVSLAPRNDALTFVVWARRALGIAVPPAVGFILAFAVTAVACWRKLRPALYGVALATTYFFFFAFNKWAFANYYFLIGSLAAMGAALWLHAPADAPADVDLVPEAGSA